VEQHLRWFRAKGLKSLKGLKRLNIWGAGKSRFFKFTITGTALTPVPARPRGHRCAGTRPVEPGERESVREVFGSRGVDRGHLEEEARRGAG
jgi:hypothetical protein